MMNGSAPPSRRNAHDRSRTCTTLSGCVSDEGTRALSGGLEPPISGFAARRPLHSGLESREREYRERVARSVLGRSSALGCNQRCPLGRRYGNESGPARFRQRVRSPAASGPLVIERTRDESGRRGNVEECGSRLHPARRVSMPRGGIEPPPLGFHPNARPSSCQGTKAPRGRCARPAPTASSSVFNDRALGAAVRGRTAPVAARRQGARAPSSTFD